ncbi:hypothetical protein ACJX0J_018544 [Zea mays]
MSLISRLVPTHMLSASFFWDIIEHANNLFVADRSTSATWCYEGISVAADGSLGIGRIATRFVIQILDEGVGVVIGSSIIDQICITYILAVRGHSLTVEARCKDKSRLIEQTGPYISHYIRIITPYHISMANDSWNDDKIMFLLACC